MSAHRREDGTGPPPTRYVDGGKGLIGYQVVGDGPVDLVYDTGATSHVDVRWDWPAAAHFLDRLAGFSRLILFDRRGTGVSQRTGVEDLPTWEEWTDDLLTVLDAVGSERAAVFAVLDAGPMALLFAATHPHRTRAVILGNTAARYVADDDYPEGLAPELAELVLEYIEQTWGSPDAAAAACPDAAADAAFVAWLAKYMRASADPRATAAQWRSLFASDFRRVLPAVTAPALVISRESYVTATPQMGAYLAQRIAGARLLPLSGGDSLFYTADAETVLDTVQEFLTGARPVPEPDRVLATVLFTDVVGSTRRAVELGDLRWRRVLDQLEATIDQAVHRYQGRVVKTTGDGAVATFDAPGRAVRCAEAVRSAVAGLGLQVRTGVHTGEVEVRGEDIGGVGVHIAARVAGLAAPDEVLVSRTVVDLVAGSSLRFAERGAHDLKGVPGTWTLFALARREGESATAAPTSD